MTKLELAHKYYRNMNRRTKPHWNYNKPTYQDCSISEDFSYFHLFYEWCVIQVGFGLEDYQLDKDILVKGNKEYTSTLCVFVPPVINNFILFKENTNRKYMFGVMKAGNSYRGNISKFGATIKSKSFSSEMEAHQWYIQQKNLYAKEIADKIKAGEYVVDNRVLDFFEKFDCTKYLNNLQSP